MRLTSLQIELALYGFLVSCLASGCGGSSGQDEAVVTVTLTATPEDIAAGASSTLNWTSSSATTCSASGAWSGQKQTSGSETINSIAATSTFTLQCTGSGGSGSQSVVVTVVPAPTLQFSANPPSVTTNGSATLTWSSTNATSCTASGAWNGPRATSGSQSTAALSATSTFSLNCSGVGGTVSGNVTVTVSTQPPGPLNYRRVVVDASSPADAWMKNIADLNGDALPDLVVSGAAGPIVWYAAPGWTRRVIAQNASSESGSAVGDIDGDGDVDVVVGAAWFENVGNGSAWVAHSLPNAGSHDIVIGDVNGDARPDIAMRGETAFPVTVSLQVSKTTWTSFTVDPGLGLNGLDLADVNLDGRRDIVVGGVWMENPGGNVASAVWTRRTFTSGWNEFAAVKVVDLDGDTRRDIVLSVSEAVGKLSWFKAPADPRTGPWAENVIATNLDRVHGFDVIDVDKDGALDVVVSEFDGQGRLIAYLQRTSGWQANVIGTDRLHNMRAGDLGNDGDYDFFGVAAFGVNPVIMQENTATSAAPNNRVLVFSHTLGFRHDSIPDAITALRTLASANGFQVDDSEDPAVFTAVNLARYKVVVFLNPSGNVLDTSQRADLQQFVQNGGGFVGIHNAAAFVLEDWDWYTRLVGTRYESEIVTQPTRLQIVDGTHLSTQGLPNPWMLTAESYNYTSNPKTNGVTVLVNLDESSVSGGTMGVDHPFSWYRGYDGGRAWYTVGGSTSAEYLDANFRAHLVGAIRYAGGF